MRLSGSCCRVRSAAAAAADANVGAAAVFIILCIDVCISATKSIDWCHRKLNYSDIILFVHIASEFLSGAAFVIHGINQGLYCCVFQLLLKDDCWIGAASPESNIFSD